MQPVVTQATLALEQLEKTPRSNPAREKAALALLLASGCRQVREQFVSGRDGHNLVCSFGEGGRHFVVGAHHDSWGRSPGVADNWTGIVLLAAIADHFSRAAPAQTWSLVAFAGEERGLLGAKQFITEEPVMPDMMINLDTLGTGAARFDPRSAPELQCLAEQAGMRRSPRFRSFAGDWEAFWREGVPVLAIHAVSHSLVPHLHSSRDTRALVDREILQDTFEATLKVIDALDRGKASRGHPG